MQLTTEKLSDEQLLEKKLELVYDPAYEPKISDAYFIYTTMEAASELSKSSVKELQGKLNTDVNKLWTKLAKYNKNLPIYYIYARILKNIKKDTIYDTLIEYIKSVGEYKPPVTIEPEIKIAQSVPKKEVLEVSDVIPNTQILDAPTTHGCDISIPDITQPQPIEIHTESEEIQIDNSSFENFNPFMQSESTEGTESTNSIDLMDEIEENLSQIDNAETTPIAKDSFTDEILCINKSEYSKNCNLRATIIKCLTDTTGILRESIMFSNKNLFNVLDITTQDEIVNSILNNITPQVIEGLITDDFLEYYLNS